MSAEAEPVPPTAVHDVLVNPLARFTDERGTVSRMLSSHDPHFRSFGEIYFSSVRPGVVKAWKRHHRATVNLTCVLGEVRLCCYDDRVDSPTRGVVQEELVGPDRYALVTVPPGVWHGFAGIASVESLVASCPSEPTDPAEFDRLDHDDPLIPYEW